MFCKACQQDKPAEAFYVSNHAKCKECVKTAVKRNRLENIDHYRAFDRARASIPHRVAARAEYQKTAAFSVSHAAAAKRWAAKHPERKRANEAVNNAVRDGRLTPWPACAIPDCCGKPEAHHADYSLPLAVTWLCDRHHKETHKLARELEREAANANSSADHYASRSNPPARTSGLFSEPNA